MSGMFSKPKRPRIPEPPPLPTLDDAAAKAAVTAKKRRQAVLTRGRSSTILSKSLGGFAAGQPTVRKTKLGGE